MPTYCYTLSLDGEERELPSAEHDTEAAAITQGGALLLDAVKAAATPPQAAYVAVFEDEGADDEPLGAWDWSQDAPDPVWTPEE